MKSDAKSLSFFIGWDVGGWNCDNKPNIRGAMSSSTIIWSLSANRGGAICGCAYRSRDYNERHVAKGIVRNVQGRISSGTSGRDIDALLGFSDEFVDLINWKAVLNPTKFLG